jgi:prepilin-type N-terminal cleavage/methylation domain-containing protein
MNTRVDLAPSHRCSEPPPSERPAAASPRGFTLVEILVVLIIVAMLAGLLTPAVMQSLRKARNAAIKSEIDMLHMAVMNYKNEYGSFPPCNVLTPLISGTDAASRHILRLFPRVGGTAAARDQVLNLGYANFPNTAGVVTYPLANLTPLTALTCWLFGYTGDPSRPVLMTTNVVTAVTGSAVITGGLPIAKRKKLYDFDASRLQSNYTYCPPQKPGSPYIYIDSSNYSSFVYSGTSAAQLAVPGTQCMPAVPRAAIPVNTPATPEAWYFTAFAPNKGFFNADTFQILCAGSDEKFGTDDDLSNFWPGTRKEYLDSLGN